MSSANTEPALLASSSTFVRVCVPGHWSNQQIEDFTNDQKPSAQPLSLSKESVAVSCNQEDREGFVHIDLSI